MKPSRWIFFFLEFRRKFFSTSLHTHLQLYTKPTENKESLWQGRKPFFHPMIIISDPDRVCMFQGVIISGF